MPAYAAYDSIRREETFKDEEPKSGEDEDACSKLWNVYIDEAQRYDQDLLQGWKSDMDGMLLFSALYSASLTAFIIESYKNLQRDEGETAVKWLAQISTQLASISNGATAPAPTPPPFEPTPAAVVCNTLWFLSLALALTCSLLATFVQQWTRDFIHKTTMRPSPVRRARILAFAYFGLKEFRMHTLVDVIPILLHISLILFFTGLVAFLSDVNTALTALMASVLFIFLVFYVVLTFLPVLYLHSPYRTPFSNFIWRWGNALSGRLLRKHGLKTDHNINLTEAMLQKSFLNSSKRDVEAVKYTMKSLTDNTELLPLIEAIPDLIYGPNGVRSANIPLITPLLQYPAPHMNLVSRITTFAGKSGAWTDPLFRARSIKNVPRALWSLAFMLLKNPHLLVPTDTNNFQSFWFNLSDVRSLSTSTLLEPEYAISALAAVRLVREYGCVFAARQLLDSPSHNMQDLRKQLEAALKIWKDLDLSSGGDTARMVQLFSSLLSRLLSQRGSTNQVHDVHTRLELCARTAHSELNTRLKTKGVFILSEFLTNALSIRAYPHQFSIMCDIIFPNLFDHPIITEIDDVQAFSAYRPFQRIESIIANDQMDAFTDDLFNYSLQLFFLTPQARSDLPGPASYREVIQKYIIARDRKDHLALRKIWQKDQSGCLEACILQDIQGGAEHPEVSICAAWRLCQSMHDTSSSRIPNRLREFGAELFRALRSSPVSRPEGLHNLVRMFADWIILDNQIYWLRQIAAKGPLKNGPNGRDMRYVGILGQELLPDLIIPGFYPSETNDWIEEFRSYLMSLNLSLVARYIETIIRNPGDDSEDGEYYIQALRRMTRNFLVYQGVVADESQINFVECVLELVSSHVKKPASPTCLELLKAVFMMSRDWRWLRNRRCAKHLSEAVTRHKNSDCFKSFGWEEELLTRCRSLANPVTGEFVNGARHRHGRSISRPTNVVEPDMVPVELSTPWSVSHEGQGQDSPADLEIPTVYVSEPIREMTPIESAMPWSDNFNSDGGSRNDESSSKQPSEESVGLWNDEPRRWSVPLISKSNTKI